MLCLSCILDVAFPGPFGWFGRRAPQSTGRTFLLGRVTYIGSASSIEGLEVLGGRKKGPPPPKMVRYVPVEIV